MALGTRASSPVALFLAVCSALGVLPAGANHGTPDMARCDQDSTAACHPKSACLDESNADNYIDFVAIGNAGVNYMKAKNNTLGSVAEMVVKAKRMNVIFCP